MDRRDFMKMCSVAGLGLAGLGLTDEKNALAEGQPTHPLFIAVNMTGGVDETMFHNPIGNVGATRDRQGTPQANSQGNIVNDWYSPSDIRSVGHFTYAPPDLLNAQTLGGANIDPMYLTTFGQSVGADESVKDLFARIMADRVLRVIGINTQTNSHTNGQANTFSGRRSETTACIMALYAAAKERALPLAFISGGGYSETGGTAPRARINNLDAFQALIYPNRRDPDNPDSELYLTEETMQRVMAMRQNRLDRMSKIQNLPTIKNRQSLLWLARSGVGNLKLIEQYLPANDDGQDNLMRQGNIMLAAYLAGLTLSGSISRGGFDTHGDNDAGTEGDLEQVLRGVIHLYHRAMELEALTGFDIVNNIYLMFGSEFSRTPSYNGGMGKDHYGESTMLFAGPGINAGRTIGAVDDAQKYLKVNPANNQVDEGGEEIKMGNVHRWLRKTTGIEEAETTRMFPINDVEVDFDFNI